MCIRDSQSAGILDLSTLVSATPAGGTLTFTGTQVTGSNLDPTGLTGVQTIAVSYTVNSCTLNRSLLINVLAPGNPACSGSGGGSCSTPVISKVDACNGNDLSLIHISEPTRLLSISYAVFCLKKKK